MAENFKTVIPSKLYRSGQIAPSEIKSLTAVPFNVTKIVSLDQANGSLIKPYIPQNIEQIMFPIGNYGKPFDSIVDLVNRLIAKDKQIEALQKENEQLTKACESFKNAMMDNQDKACLGHIEEVEVLKERLEAADKMAEATELMADTFSYLIDLLKKEPSMQNLQKWGEIGGSSNYRINRAREAVAAYRETTK